MNESNLIEEARAWLADDPDPATRGELTALIESQDLAELGERFGSRLEFGTAGIRGRLGAGPNRMNRALVRKVTAGLAAYLLETIPETKKRGVVIGRDGRHMSAEFLADTAATLAGAGIPVHVFPDVVPTPVCAYAVTALGAAAGVMITASHNPPEDNGYKVYWENGAQIIPPHDRGISAAIDAIGPVPSIPQLEEAPARNQGLWVEVEEAVTEGYVQSVLDLRRHPESPTDLGVVYTPLHGVGGRYVREVFQRGGYGRFEVVTEQAEPDPDFPTVRFPNPEEKGAMDLALAAAEKQSADIVLANDPDADRLAAVVRSRDGAYRALSGNEIGIALAYYLLTESPRATEPLVMTTVVSTSLLSKMAATLGAHYAETLTGYKWIANNAIELKRAKGYEFVFGFEEALGYTVGELVRDKDGVGAALVFADLAAFCKTRGETVLDWIESIYRRFGLHLSGARSVTLSGSEGASRIAALMESLRSEPPDAIASVPVTARTDVQSGRRIDLKTGEETPVAFPSSNVLRFDLEDGSRILARPSGTEPKIKYYFEVTETIGPNEEVSAAERRAQVRLDLLMDAFPPEAAG